MICDNITHNSLDAKLFLISLWMIICEYPNNRSFVEQPSAMKPFLALLAVCGVANAADIQNKTSPCIPVNGNIYQFKLKNVTENGEVNLATLAKDKVVLVVNVATFWGYAAQYPQLNALVNKYSKRNFTIIATPSNQFQLQEPASKMEILNGLQYMRPGGGFQPNFIMTNKLDVNGEDMHDMFKYLKNSCPISPQDEFSQKGSLFYEPLHTSDIRWNFEKFLIGRNGKPIRRYHSTVTPSQMEKDIEEALAAK